MNENPIFARAHLDFVPSALKHYLDGFIRCYRRGARSVRIEPANPTSVSLARLIANTYGVDVRVNDPATPADCVILLETDADALSVRLHALIDSPCQVVAPITSRYYRNHSYFLMTVPKAGTHLLFHLMRSFQIDFGGPAPPTRAGHYHCLMHNHTHTTASRFFEELSNYPGGGVDHPFFTHPALFIYRNPMDVVVSETFYLTRKEKTPLAHYYSRLSDHERCRSLIADDPIIGCLRDRIRGYIAWLRLPNVIPVSFEELIGRQGDGSDEAQQRTIWSLQLKLHVPGSPREYGDSIFNTGSWTFRQGTINSHRGFFRAEHYEAFRLLKQDFMRELGYDMDDSFEGGYLPCFVDEYRRRPLRLQSASTLEDTISKSSRSARAGRPRGRFGMIRRVVKPLLSSACALFSAATNGRA